MAATSYESVLELAGLLSAADQVRLTEELQQRSASPAPPEKKKHSIMELRGLGKELWREIDTTEYLRQERASWDG